MSRTESQSKNWQSIIFKDFVKLQRGFDLPKQDRVNGEYPVIASTSVTDYHDEYKVESPCVATGRSGALGKVLYIKSKCWPLNTTLWVKDFKGNDPYFVYSKLKTLNLEQYNSGSGVPTLNRNHLDRIKIFLPPVSTQVRISEVLSAYDDLIENNMRRIRILEEMAQAIYKEWFVKFRFPGHEKIKMVDSGTEFGKIPEGWEVRDLYSIANVKTGYPFKSNLFTVEQEGFKAVRIRDILAGSTAVYTSEEADDSYIVRKGDFLIGMDGIFHMNHWHDRDSYLVQRVCRVRTKEERLRAYVALALHQPIKYLESTLSGSTVSHLGTRHLREIEVVVPDEDFDGLLSLFNSFLDSKLNYANQNVLLRQARDLLLPKLVTGEVEV